MLDVPKDVTVRIDLRRQRRLCDCDRCVRHATRLLATSWFAETPVTLGLRYVALPGLHLPGSSSADRGRLVDLLRQHVEKTLLVCSCPDCTVHRNFVTTWVEARRLAEFNRNRAPPPPPPVAGGCHEPRRD